VIDVLPPVNLKLQRSPGAKPFIAHYDRVKSWEGEVPKSWLRNVPGHEEFVMLSPLPLLDIEASTATESSEEMPLADDAVSSNRESEARNETGDVPDIDETRSEETAECVDRANEAQSADGRPKRARKPPAYLADYYGQ